MKYRVCTEDHFHYQDAAERVDSGEFESAEAAMEAAQKIVDQALRELYQPGFSPGALYDAYMQFGADPFVVSEDKTCTFSARTYAQMRCASICAELGSA